MTRVWTWLKSAWAALVVASIAIWWALTERRARRRAEARADLERDLAEVERARKDATTTAEIKATKERAAIEAERAQAEVKAKVDIQAAERALEAVREEHRETGAVTAESQRLYDLMRREGRLP